MHLDTHQEADMKKTLPMLATTIVLSTALWLGYYATAGGIPPTSEVTTVLVGIAFGMVFGTRWLWLNLKKSGKKNEKGTNSLPPGN